MFTEMPKVPDYSDKVLSMTIMDDENNRDLIHPRFELQGGRLFILGETPEGATHGNWTSGATWAIAWDRVTDYFVFDTLQEYFERIKISAEHEDDEQ